MIGFIVGNLGRGISVSNPFTQANSSVYSVLCINRQHCRCPGHASDNLGVQKTPRTCKITVLL